MHVKEKHFHLSSSGQNLDIIQQTPDKKNLLVAFLHTYIIAFVCSDRKFGVKSRLSGSLSVTVNVIKQNLHNSKLLLPCLQVLRVYCTSCK